MESKGEVDVGESQKRIVHACDVQKNISFGYETNAIKNTKYTILTFLPKNLKEQFSLHINRYFLLIACLQLISILTPVNPLTTWGPLIFIFAITAAKEGVDDFGRYQEDKRANQRPVVVVRNGLPEPVAAEDIRVGDIVHIEEGDEFPCDLLLLKTSTENGSCFVQTTNLDGETNFKSRSALPDTQALSKSDAQAFSGVIMCAAPNARVYQFDSRLWMEPSPNLKPPRSQPLAVTSEQLLQQTTRLVNTDWVLGVAVYTGNQTKFGMNRGEPPFKYTKVDHLVNLVAVLIFLFQLLLVAILGAIGELRRQADAKDNKLWYLDFEATARWFTGFIIPARFLLLNSTMIPISMKVTLDFCKLIYSRFVNYDLMMYHEPTDEPAYAKNTSICEDLGQVEYILTDKTGTLTENIMVFKQCAVNGVVYDDVACIRGGALEAAVAKDGAEANLMRHCALNSGVVPVVTSAGELRYKGSSPDEVALVEAAAQYGIRLVHRQSRQITLNCFGHEEHYELLQELKFDSDRKRMSVVVRNMSTNIITLLCKGADDAVSVLVHEDQAQDVKQALMQVEGFAMLGLRTLFFGQRQVDPKEYEAWEVRFREANTAMDNRIIKLASVYQSLEKDLSVQGCSAIEDKLQEGVAHSITLLRRAGTKIWMLTGDKFSTALQIATSCGLKTNESVLCAIEGTDGKTVENQLYDHVARVSHVEEYTVIVRGSTLELALLYHPDLLRLLCLRAHTVICCRVTPAQKAKLVLLVREAGYMTLAIGDGGNDVGMIQQAHVGVGIRGKEGLQAARAADYTISTFRALERLVLIHGRYAYMRTALVAQYSFYKSLMFCFVQIGFAFVSDFSGATLFNSLCITVYNAALFIPIVSFTLDKDVPFDTMLAHPRFYKDCQQGSLFNGRSFGWWCVRAVYQGVVLFTVTIYTHGPQYHFPKHGYGSDWETLGIVAFSAYLWVQAVTMTMEFRSLTLPSVVAIWGMHALTFCILLFTNAFLTFDTLNGYYIVFVALADPTLWLHNLLVVTLCILPVYAATAYRFLFHPGDLDRARQASRQNSLDSETSLRHPLLRQDRKEGPNDAMFAPINTTDRRNSQPTRIPRQSNARRPVHTADGPATELTQTPSDGSSTQGQGHTAHT